MVIITFTRNSKFNLKIYSRVSPEGEQVQLTYTADERGYLPQGSHLPTPPPTPDYILKALEFIARNPPQQQ